jgi:Skp family chaperone for outer membrane proteins
MIKKEIANKLFKTKLSEQQKVELAAIDDLKEIYQESQRIMGLQEDATKWGRKVESELKQLKKIVSDAEGISRNAVRSAGNYKTEADKVFNKIEIMAKELGISPNDIKGYSEALKSVNQMFENQNSASFWQEYTGKILQAIYAK